MANILLTNYCNRSCPYCFAKARVKLGTALPLWELSRDELDVVLAYLVPGRDVVSLLGGEPTLHSRYAEFLAVIIERGFHTKIFTNGTTPQLREIPPGVPLDMLNIILNLNSPDSYSTQELAQIEANCRAFGDSLHLSFNVHRPDFTWDFLRQAICDFGIGRRVRVGIAQPIMGADNAYLREDDFRAACRRMLIMAEDLAEYGISLGFDCGFRLCAFTNEELGVLAQCGTQFLFGCRPVLDIGPDLMVWRCFPFSTDVGVKLTDYKSLADLESYYSDRTKSWMAKGSTASCENCDHLRVGVCNGGCLSRALKNGEERPCPY